MTIRKPPPKKPTTSALQMPPDTAPTPTTFKVEPWSGNVGEKIIIYGDTGIGKSSLAYLAPKPVFLGLDEGAGKLRDWDGNPPKRILNINSFADARAALQQVDLYDDYETVIVDHLTILEDWASVHVVNTVTNSKGFKMANMEAYGWKEGYRHLYDVMRGPLADCDELVRRGKNVILIAQSSTHKIQHAGGEEFLRQGPRLYSGYPISIEDLYCEWANEIYRIDYSDTSITKKKISGSTERAVYAQPEVWFRAKSRAGLPATIAFETQTSDDVWQFLFGGE